ncbi:TonB-dependent receptor [Termitidicoccus mucosus]|uniref:TonB-dependent receptor plug domain-containing protein n=1 Tax=Termitidicoccus mucosus TaxID=1184151 RepID=A0A178IJ83_9BACT|nr:hypothetical protein AW736_10805 [Opitutaceae bacterium TSB47]
MKKQPRNPNPTVPPNRRGAVKIPVPSALALLLAALPPLAGQETPAPQSPSPSDDEIVTLSVFEVTDSRDVGYHASTTLAGTGTGEDLKNIPMSVDVLTKEFLEDIGATDIYEASRYALGGEFSPNDGDATSGPDLRSFSFRGFRTAWQTRDFFIWQLPADGYSYERLDFMRGPNAVLAGDAEPGGVMNINTKRAHWKNRTTLGARVGSWGRYRGTLDWNRAVTKNWAIRLNAVYDEKESWKDWVGDTRKSALLSTTFKLSRMTQLRFSGEYGKLDSHPGFSLPREQYSVWEAAGSPAHTRYSAGGSAYGTNRMGTNAATPGYWYIYDNAAKQLRDWNGMGQTNLPSGNNSKPLIDESIYPRDLQLTGPDTYNNREYWTVTAWFEHRFTHDLTFELAYNYQTYTRNGLLPNGINYLHRDPNPLLPDNITPNPHFGDTYADYRWQKSWTKFAGHSYRAALVYDWDRLSWTKQRFHLGIGARSESSDRWTSAEIWDNPAALANHTITSKYLYRRIYVSDARAPGALRFDGLIDDPDGTGVVSYFAPTVNMDATKTFMSYGQLSASGEYFGGIIRSTLGVRRDYAKNKTHEALLDEVTRIYAYDPASPERTTLDVNNTSVMAGIIYNWWKPLSFTFNYSQSYRPASQPVFLIDGNNPPPRLGTGKEVGIRYSALNDRLSISACLYDITQENNVISFTSFNINPLTQINAIWNDTVINTLHPGWINNDLPGEDNDRREMESVRGRGFEAAVHLNLTRGWAFRASYGLADNETSETAVLTRAYIERNMPQWEAMAASDPAIANSIGDRIDNLKEFLKGQVPGSKSLRVSRHTANMFTRYAFRHGRLKGLSLGGGLNYRSGVILYYDGDKNPVRGTGGTLVNLMAGYAFKAGRTQWNLTLNINNALNHITIRQLSAASASYADPRSWSLNTSVTF